jgi:hypothetical protein
LNLERYFSFIGVDSHTLLIQFHQLMLNINSRWFQPATAPTDFQVG